MIAGKYMRTHDPEVLDATYDGLLNGIKTTLSDA